MNKVGILHDKTTKIDLIKKYYFALIPLFLFSIYKNGLLLYNNDLIPIKNVFIPLYFPLISILIGYLISKIYKEHSQENILICLIVSACISINTNLLIYPILLFVSLFIGKYILEKAKINFNLSSFIRIMMVLGLLLNSYSYMNIAEKLNKFNYNYFDLFLGHGIGGLASTSALILIISFLILVSNKYYKKEIPFTASLIYLLISLVAFFFAKDATILKEVVNGRNYFGFIFIAADLYITPYSKKGMRIYGLLIGSLTGVLSLLGLGEEACYISILLISIFIPMINRITNKKYLK